MIASAIPTLSETDHARFWSFVHLQGGKKCWIWTGKHDRDGYGVFTVKGRSFLAHRIAWSIVNGPIQPDQQALHKCDNPGCPRPSHLFTGTHADNMVDMTTKGRRRSLSGEANGNSSLTEAQASAVKRLFRGGASQASIMRRLGVGKGAVQGIVHGKTWRHLP